MAHYDRHRRPRRVAPLPQLRRHPRPVQRVPPPRARSLIGVVWNQGWANDMADLLVEAKVAVERQAIASTGRWSSTSGHSISQIRVRYGKFWSPRASPIQPVPPRRQAPRVREEGLPPHPCWSASDTQLADVLRFCSDFRVLFTNNQAERDIRLVKLQQKISGSWRNDRRGPDYFCAIRSYISTLRKNQRRDVLGGLRLLFEGQARATRCC